MSDSRDVSLVWRSVQKEPLLLGSSRVERLAVALQKSDSKIKHFGGVLDGDEDGGGWYLERCMDYSQVMTRGKEYKEIGVDDNGAN